MADTVDKLTVDDPRFTTRSTVINGRTYGFLHAKPGSGKHVATVVLAHGFPDLAFTWRYLMPAFLAMDVQALAVDMPGYGGTDAPRDVAEYSYRRTCADLAALIAQEVPGERVILGGHDWGGLVPWRMHIWQPETVLGLFSVCTPYPAPSPKYFSTEEVVQMLPNFRYQLQFAGPELEAALNARGPEATLNFLDSMHGGLPRGIFTTAEGADIARLHEVGRAPDMDDAERAYYAKNLGSQGWHGPLSWYRTRKVNFDDEQVLFQDGRQPPKVAFPSLFVMAESDPALPPSMSAGMEKHFEEGMLTRVSVPGRHWAMWSYPREVNQAITEWLGKLLRDQEVKAKV